MTVDPRLLTPLVVLTEERHFGRAAQRLATSQPALSQQITRLETQLGVRLFERTSRHVEPTLEGLELAREAERLLGGFDRAVARLRPTSEEPSSVVIAHTLSASARAAPALAAAASVIDVELRLLERWSAEVASDVARGSADVGLAHAPPMLYDAHYEVLAHEPLVALVGTSHRLSGRKRAALADFGKETLVLWPRDLAPGLHEHAVQACRSAGFEPSRRTMRLVGGLALGQQRAELRDDGYMIVPAGVPVRDGMVAVELEDPVLVSLTLVTPARAVWGEAQEVADRLRAYWRDGDSDSGVR